MLAPTELLLDAIEERLNAASPRAIKIRFALAAPDCVEVQVRRRWSRLWGGGRVLVGDETVRETLIDAIDLAAQEISHRVGRPWPPGATEDDEPHLTVEKDAVRIWFGDSRWPLMILEPIPLKVSTTS
jgi:hypothetical protein